jgi:DNA-binding NarL/FixJ family response regulator
VCAGRRCRAGSDDGVVTHHDSIGMAEAVGGWGFPGLTYRQSEVLRLCEQGLATEAIAAAMNVTPAAVKWHVAQLLKRLEVATRVEAVRHAKSHGWL